MYGTPLNAKNNNNRDKKVGRLHGAWQGGFSAGYFNTAGSKEGWAPAKSYTVTRETKGQHRHQNVDDFMDDEDRADFESGVELKLKDEYTLSDSVTRTLTGGGKGFGYDMLRRLGWTDKPRQDYDSGDAAAAAAAPESSRGEGIGFETQSFKKRKRPRLAANSEDEEEEDNDALPQLMPKRKLGVSNKKHQFVKKKKAVQGTVGKCQDGVSTLRGFVLMNEALLKRVSIPKFTVPDEFEPVVLRTRRRFEESKQQQLEPEPEPEQDSARPIDKDTADAVLAAYTAPYGDDAKSSRYRAFLEYCAHVTDTNPSKNLPQEQKEFTQVAQMFKPVSGAMASMFTETRRASTQHEPLNQKQKQKQKRVVTEFWPCELLCQRFNVPYRASPEERADELIASVQANSEAEHEHEPEPAATVDTTRNEALEADRAPDDLFKLVFGSDDNVDVDERL